MPGSSYSPWPKTPTRFDYAGLAIGVSGSLLVVSTLVFLVSSWGPFWFFPFRQNFARV